MHILPMASPFDPPLLMFSCVLRLHTGYSFENIEKFIKLLKPEKEFRLKIFYCEFLLLSSLDIFFFFFLNLQSNKIIMPYFYISSYQRINFSNEQQQQK